LKDGGPSKSYNVRVILKWFGAERPGSRILSDIKAVMKQLGLVSEPSIDDAGIDDAIRIDDL
jgi:hypothetical protein